MKLDIKDNQAILKEVFNPIILETDNGKQLHICLRDSGFEVKIDNGKWYMIESETDLNTRIPVVDEKTGQINLKFNVTQSEEDYYL